MAITSGLSEGDRYVVRVPHETNPHQVRVLFTSSVGGTYSPLLSSLRFIGSDSGGSTWDYYADEQELGGLVASLTLQVTSSASANGTSTFKGNLVMEKVLEALGVSALPSGGISQSAGDTRYLRQSGVSTDLGDADDLRARITGELVDGNNNRTITSTDYGKIIHYWGNNSNIVFTLPNPTAADRGK